MSKASSLFETAEHHEHQPGSGLCLSAKGDRQRVTFWTPWGETRDPLLPDAAGSWCWWGFLATVRRCMVELLNEGRKRIAFACNFTKG